MQRSWMNYATHSPPKSIMIHKIKLSVFTNGATYIDVITRCRL